MLSSNDARLLRPRRAGPFRHLFQGTICDPYHRIRLRNRPRGTGPEEDW